jgi:hypothetical protein
MLLTSFSFFSMIILDNEDNDEFNKFDDNDLDDALVEHASNRSVFGLSESVFRLVTSSSFSDICC